MTGRTWHRIALAALLLVHMDLAAQIMNWIPGEWGIVCAFVVSVFFMAFWLLVPLRERPRCGFQLPVTGPMLKASDHERHHCADELGHVSDTHKCQCGLGYTPIPSVDGYYRDASGCRWLLQGDEARPIAEHPDSHGHVIAGIAWSRGNAENFFGPLVLEVQR